MVEIHLYGQLRRYGPSPDATVPCVLRVQPGASHRTVADLVGALGIPPEDVASVFRNGRWERDGVKSPVEGTARLGLFPAKMSLLYV